MSIRRTRVLSISQDDDLHSHFEILSGLPEDDSIKVMAPKRSVEEVISDNLKLTAMAGDVVNLPAHYARFKIEPIRFIEENHLGFLPGNVIKYTCRHDAKNGIEDLKKAKRCLELMIAQLEGDPDWWKRRAA